MTSTITDKKKTSHNRDVNANNVDISDDEDDDIYDRWTRIGKSRLDVMVVTIVVSLDLDESVNADVTRRCSMFGFS